MPTDRGAAALASARSYQDRIVRFLRDIIAIPAESGQEEARCRRVLAEYEALGFDEAYIDGLGSVIARIGNGPVKILMDGHIDCVGVGDRSAWDFDPFEGKEEDGKIWGRGAVDELPAIAAMAYGARILADRGWPEAVTLYLSASVMEEDCDGYCMLHLIERENIRPDYVVLGEPTDLDVYRGQRGRLEATITTKGRVGARRPRRARRQRALQDGADHLRCRGAQHPARPRRVPRHGLGHRVVHRVHHPVAQRGAGFSRGSPSTAASPSARPRKPRWPSCGHSPTSATPRSSSSTMTGPVGRGLRAQQPKYYPTWVLEEEHPLVQGVAERRRRGPPRPAEDLPLALLHQRRRHHGNPRHPDRRLRPRLEELAHTTERTSKSKTSSKPPPSTP